MAANDDSPNTSRNVTTIPTKTFPVHVNRWALIVGISKYKDERLNLKFADRDAEELALLLQTPSGGAFEADHIVKLINEAATTANIIQALRTFLKKPAPEDIVLIYFACHGGPDPQRPKNIYLIMHDTNRDDISGTGLRMNEINQTLIDTLLAERVVIIADTCHSGSIGNPLGGRGTSNNAAMVNEYLEEVSRAKSGVALLTSAQASEVALEGEHWNGGHGVFTHFLLQGLKGEADGFGGRNKDGKVTVGELFEYVRDSVMKETSGGQHPVIGTSPYDPNLPLAITGGLSAQEHYQAGCSLYELGWLLDDRGRFASATDHFTRAISLSKGTGSASYLDLDTDLRLGQSWLALQEYAKAAMQFQRVIDRKDSGLLADAYFHLGIARAKQRKHDDAIAAFERFLEHAPEHDDAAWIKAYTETLKEGGSRKYALLIGIDHYSGNIPSLSGCVNDVKLMQDVLVTKFGFDPEDTVCLTDASATRDQILKSFKDLAARATIADAVIVLFSGHTKSENMNSSNDTKYVPDDVYLITHDSSYGKDKESEFHGLGAKELHEALESIPANYKTLIIDSHPNSLFTDLTNNATYTTLLGAQPGQIAYEAKLEYRGEDITTGAFSSALIQALRAVEPATFTSSDLLKEVKRIMQLSEREQTFDVLGPIDRIVFAQQGFHLDLYDFSHRRTYPSMSLEFLERWYKRFQVDISHPFPRAFFAFAEALEKMGNHHEAIKAAQIALSQSKNQAPKHFLLGKLQFETGQYAEALASFQTFANLSAITKNELGTSLLDRLEQLQHIEKHALLVGISKYQSPEVPEVRGAKNDSDGLRKILIGKYGFQPQNVTVLVDQDATRSKILEAFRNLVEKAQREPAIFFFSGNGSTDHKQGCTIVSSDGRREQIFDIERSELSNLARGAENLTTILDAGWTGPELSDDRPMGRRFIPRDTTEQPTIRGLAINKEQWTSEASVRASGSLAVDMHNRV